MSMNHSADSKRIVDVDMLATLERSLRKLPAKTPPAGLYGRIQEAIAAEMQLRSLRRKTFGFASGFVALGVIAAGLWNFLAQELAQSSFVEYLQMFWSDRDVLLVNWKQAMTSLLESLPVANLMVWLLLSFFAIGFAWMLVQTWNKSHAHGMSRHLPLAT